jgi:hypothetical protein
MKLGGDKGKDLSRRSFIKTAAIGAGTAALAGLGADRARATWLSEVPKWDHEAEVVILGIGASECDEKKYQDHVPNTGC